MFYDLPQMDGVIPGSVYFKRGSLMRGAEKAVLLMQCRADEGESPGVYDPGIK